MFDASTCGYGPCSYLRLEDESEKVHLSFVMGKVCATPKKKVSIPRLELAAATISVNIGDKLKYEMEYEDIKDCYWTDSKVVLGFISNESRCFHTQPTELSLSMSILFTLALCGNCIEQGLRGEIRMDQGS